MVQPKINSQYRVVDIETLKDACKAVSGTCHRFWVERETKNRVYVAYSNPDEYARETPMDWNTMFGKKTAHIVLDFADVQHDNWDGEGWQAFEPIKDQFAK